jgi:hypothetical protein
MDLVLIGLNVVDRISVALDWDKWRALVNVVVNLWVP